ncbi:MAG: polysaccharide biosynthesis tyrosine autokinase [Bacteroidia bacterium]|nr:polysaccharide biosynthesis tyrosine autokinase [Bacteroidia bacterium]
MSPMPQAWNLRRILILLTRNWWRIALILLGSIAMAWLFLRYTTATYLSQATIQIDFSQSSLLKGKESAETFLSYENIADSYVELFTTHDLVETVVRELKLEWEVYSVGKVGKSLIFPHPFEIEVRDSLQAFYRLFPLYIELDGQMRTFSILKNDTTICTGKVGEWAPCGQLNLRLIPAREDGSLPSGLFFVQKLHLAAAIHNWQRRISVVSKRGLTSWTISVTDISPTRARLFLQSLLKHARTYEQLIRQEQYSRALKYIDTILYSTRQDLMTVQDSLFRQERVADAPFAEARKEKTLELFSEIERQRFTPSEESTLILLEKRLKNLLDTLTLTPTAPVSTIPLPSTLSKELQEGIHTINQLIEQRGRLMQAYVSTAFPVTDITQSLVQSIKQTLYSLTEMLSLHKQIRLRQRQGLTQYKEQFYKDILSKRQFALLEDDISLRRELYRFLLEKRIQLAIDREAIVSAIRISQPPSTPNTPLYPNPLQVYILFIVLGLVGGVGGTLLWHYIHQQVSYKIDLEDLSPVPILGELPYYKEGKGLFPFSGLQLEVLRSLRSALGFLWEEGKPKVLVITSTVSGEGKSYVARGMAYAYALAGHRVLLIDADLRRASITNEVGFHGKGLSLLLANPPHAPEMLNESIIPLGREGLYLLPSGPLPPNPTELLESPFLKELVESLKTSYDLFIIDTAPMGLVPDAASILHVLPYAVMVYVFRADYSRLSFLSHLRELIHVQRLQKVYLLFNGTRLTKPRYGYGYGYGYYVESYGRHYYSSQRANGSLWKRVRELLPI